MKKNIERLKKLLTDADALAAEIAAIENAPHQAALVRNAIHNGALVHIEALEKLTGDEGVAATTKK